VARNENGLAVFERLRRKPSGKHVFLYAFDLLELKRSPYRSGRSPDWLKMKNANAPAVKREAEEDWAR
jgi:ATP-dependent DNA ligase